MKKKFLPILAISSTLSIVAEEYLVILNNKFDFNVTTTTQPQVPPEVIVPSAFANSSVINSYYGKSTLEAVLQDNFDTSGTLGYLAYNNGGFQFEFSTDKTITSYRIRSYPDVEAHDTNLNNWTLQGSNDNASWEILDTVTSESDWTNLEVREFIVDTPTAYTYYQIIWTNSGTYSYGVGFTGFEVTGN